MPVTLTPELEAEVAARVASGKYPSSESVLTEALAALSLKEQQEAKRAALIADIAAGDASLVAGLGIPLTRGFLDSIKAAGRRNDRSGRGRVISITRVEHGGEY